MRCCGGLFLLHVTWRECSSVRLDLSKFRVRIAVVAFVWRSCLSLPLAIRSSLLALRSWLLALCHTVLNMRRPHYLPNPIPSAVHRPLIGRSSPLLSHSRIRSLVWLYVRLGLAVSPPSLFFVAQHVSRSLLEAETVSREEKNTDGRVACKLTPTTLSGTELPPPPAPLPSPRAVLEQRGRIRLYVFIPSNRSMLVPPPPPVPSRRSYLSLVFHR